MRSTYTGLRRPGEGCGLGVEGCGGRERQGTQVLAVDDSTEGPRQSTQHRRECEHHIEPSLVLLRACWWTVVAAAP
jgi:hypothetical protein